MLTCLIKNQEYQTIQLLSGILDSEFYILASSFFDQHGRLPELDEIKDANSEPYIKNILNLDKNNVCSLNDLKLATGKDNITEAVQYLNNIFKDKLISATDMWGDVIVKIQSKPVTLAVAFRDDFKNIDTTSEGLFFVNAVDTLLNLYGYKINLINSAQASELGITNPANAFILNGDIYLNYDLASLTSAVHEFTHLLLGSMRFSNPLLYSELVNSVENIETYDYISKLYPNRTRLDINEEIFINQISHYITHTPNYLELNLTEQQKYEIHRNIRKMLDTLLMGDSSVDAIDDNLLYTSPLVYIANLVQSNTMENNYFSTINLSNSMKHRKLANLKEDLLRKGELLEICN